MPPRQYQLAHPAARLSSSERAVLAAALQRLDDDAKGPDEVEDRSAAESNRRTR